MKKLASILIALTLILSMFTGFSVFAAKDGYVTFFDADGNMISEITTERTVSAEIGFYPQGNTTANVIVAHYNHSGTMTGFYVAETFSVTASDELVTATVEEIDVSDTTDGAVKVFVWNSFDSISPVSKCSGEITRPEFKLEVEDGVVLKNTELYVPGAYAQIPYGVVLSEGAETLSLSVTSVNDSQSGIVAGETDKLTSLDVHMEGVSKDNKTPIVITLYDVAAKGLNLGNLALYHVENGETVQMTQVSSLEEVTAHNSFYYDALEGTLTLALATFSEITVVSDTVNGWNGKFDYSWYDADAEELKIANADQLAAFGAIVGGMDGQTQDSFEGKTVTLVSDINIGDDEKNNRSDIIFYPIGYYYTDDKNTDGTTGDYYSTVYSFEGTFDGNGHKISNFYQNTWEIKGDYSGNYYSDAMGLFGYVVNGTVKNLTVEKFSSDGEFTPTGVIAAYAVNSTFENIALVNCNPRVYNTGNGGIVGIGGNSNDPDTYKLTFNNITIDNTNKITALWGSWDVACGGLVGMFRGAGHVHMTNCHVGAQLDVFNDVCGNYQYYWYRYSGMLVGTNKNMVTDDDGYTVPETTKFHAENCTVHFGDWNNYWYCELVANSIASYTHDHQFSRLDLVDSVNVEAMTFTVGEETKAIPTTGRQNYVVIDTSKVDTNGNVIYSSENATCYHFVDGAEWKHEKAGYEDSVDEDGDGNVDLKEDKQHVYLPFNQLFTGYGWGVKHVPIYDNEAENVFEGVTILDREIANSRVKFNKADTAKDSYTTGTTVTVDELFSAVADVSINDSGVHVSATKVNDADTAYIEYSAYDSSNPDWRNRTVTFNGLGTLELTIQDYNYCTPTTIQVIVKEREPEVKFDLVFENTDKYMYRVGNDSTTPVKLSNLFSAKASATISDNVSVTVETVDDTGASGTYTSASTWTNGTIQFSGTGVVKVTITDNDYCIPTVLYLEVVDAVNATGATSATSSNVVLLNDIGSGFTVSGEYTFYGNGFTLNYTGNGQYLNNGLRQGLVTVSENGTLDNLRIKASIYPNAYMYYSSATIGTAVTAGPSSVEGDKTRYHYQLSAIVAKGNATISNCYAYGARTNVFVDTGDVTIKDSIFECGTVSNIQIQSTSEYTVTLEDVTTIQYQVKPTIGDTSKVMLGAGVLVGPDTENDPTIILNGDFKQYNWVTADDKNAVSDEAAQKIIDSAVNATDFNHTINGKIASNLGIIYMNDYGDNVVPVVNNTVLVLPYKDGTVSISSVNGTAYSLQNATADQIYSDYANADRTTTQGDYFPDSCFVFNLGDQEISYDGSEDTRYLYGDKNGVTALYQDGEDPLTLDITKLATISKYSGMPYDVTAVCKDGSGNELTATNGVVTLDAQDSYTLEFTVDDDIFYDKAGEPIEKSVKYTFTVPLILTVKEADVKNAEVSITKTALDGVYTTVNLTDYKLRINFLDCISVTDYDNTGTGTTVNLTSNISSATLTPASVNVFTTASTATITYTDGRVLTVNFSKINGSSPGTKTAALNTSGGLYLITDGALNNKPTETSSQNTCTITSVSYKGNSGSTVTNDTDVAVTWELGSSSGCLAEGTLITMADGTKKPIEQISYEDELLAWDFHTGSYAATVPSLIEKHETDDYRILNLNFADDTTVKVVVDHGFFDVEENNFVFIDEKNVDSYVGHNFVKVGENGTYEAVELIGYDVTVEAVSYYSIQTAVYNNSIAEDMFTLPAPPEMLDNDEWFDYFEIGNDMKYDEAKMQADIEKYGLYDYEDFKDYVTYEQFIAFNGPYLKVLVGRGVLTYEQILALISTYVNP